MKKINSQWHPDYDFIYEISPLVLSDPHGVFTGSFKPGVSFFELHFKDICSFLGHVCLCGAGGYRIAKLALENLKKDSPILEKDKFTLISSRDHTISDVVAFILGCSRRNDLQKNQYFINESIETNKREYHYQIAYPSIKKAETVSDQDKKLYQNAMVTMVKDVLFDRKPGLFEVQSISYSLFEMNMELLKRNF